MKLLSLSFAVALALAVAPASAQEPTSPSASPSTPPAAPTSTPPPSATKAEREPARILVLKPTSTTVEPATLEVIASLLSVELAGQRGVGGERFDVLTAADVEKLASLTAEKAKRRPWAPATCSSATPTSWARSRWSRSACSTPKTPAR